MKSVLVLFAVLTLVAGTPALALTGICGKVTNAESGQPIAGAAVCTGHGGAYTDSTGHYLIQIQPGKYQVHASATGFKTKVYPESVVVEEGHVTDGINFALEPLGSEKGGISGKVTDAVTEEPIAGALIVARGPSGDGEAHSYACGGYQIAGLPPGRYRVTASATGYESSVYPESVTVVAGEITKNINFALQPTGGEKGGISGKVTNASNGEPIPGAVVFATGPKGSGEAHTCQQGGYLIENLPAGKYRVCAQAQGFKPKVYPESVLVVGGQITDGINFALEPVGGGYGAVAGTVTNKVNGKPIFGALVVAEGPRRGQANTNMEGNYYIGELPPGNYHVMASARGFKPAPPETVVVDSGQVTQHVDFALEPEEGERGRISGTVTDSATQEPIKNAELFAWGPRGQGHAKSDSNGYYLIQELRAGKYLVRACARGYYHQVYPESVHVQAGQITENINFALVAVESGGISGFVYEGVSQTEVSGVLVTASGAKGTGQAYTTTWGEYLIKGLAAGEYTLTVSASGYSGGTYFEPILVEDKVVASFVSPPVYRLLGVVETSRSVGTDRLSVTPNVFTHSTSIRWQTAESVPVDLRILDKTGRIVRLLARSALEPGTAVWDGRDDSGHKLSRGTYFVELRTQDRRLTGRAVLVN
ncbi:hypothetical protein FJY68_01310 [candidate division WOR-3 bacterium]|uniref:FlgD/Vpr Ig-like domain-containing protein n=1 Tax=candidate division WOR-3 bacterium TaxID=2052148 RepID=A0A937XF12_UNCW3|nr:hypothetical protein [candidate division WOR-3 bacterium]